MDWRSTNSAPGRLQRSLSCPEGNLGARDRRFADVPETTLESMFELDSNEQLDLPGKPGFLGSGAFADTFRMRYKQDNHLYAVKKINVAMTAHMHKIDKNRILAEVDILINLSHPHIIRYFTSFSSRCDNFFSIVMELVDGGSLASLIDQSNEESGNKKISTPTIMKWLFQAASALDYMHHKDHKPTLHRDLKPENILLTSVVRNDTAGVTTLSPEELEKYVDPRDIRIIDLGLACVLTSSAAFAKTVLGTQHYASYNKYHAIPYDGRDDVWALGIVVVELMMGCRLTDRKIGGSLHLFTDKSTEARRENVIAECAGRDVAVGHFLGKMLKPQQENRCTSEELHLDLLLYKKRRELAAVFQQQEEPKSNIVYTLPTGTRYTCRDVATRSPQSILKDIFKTQALYADPKPDAISSLAKAIASNLSPGYGDGINKYDCFISYRVASESHVARQLYLELERLEIRPFLDERCLEPGRTWKEGFLKAICSSKTVIQLISEKALEPFKLTKPPNATGYAFDNFLIEMENALEISRITEGNISVLPVLVGKQYSNNAGIAALQRNHWAIGNVLNGVWKGLLDLTEAPTNERAHSTKIDKLSDAARRGTYIGDEDEENIASNLHKQLDYACDSGAEPPLEILGALVKFIEVEEVAAEVQTPRREALAKIGVEEVSKLAAEVQTRRREALEKIPGIAACILKLLSKHRESEEVAKNILTVVRHMCYCPPSDESYRIDIKPSDSFVKEGVCLIIPEVLVLHGFSVSEVAEQGFWAIRNISMRNSLARNKFGEANACQVIVSLLEHYNETPHTRVIESAFRAIVNLIAFDEDNQIRMELSKICEVTMSVLQRHGKTNPIIVDKVSLAVSGLCKRSTIKAKFLAEGAVYVFRQLLKEAALPEWAHASVNNALAALSVAHFEMPATQTKETLVQIIIRVAESVKEATSFDDKVVQLVQVLVEIPRFIGEDAEKLRFVGGKEGEVIVALVGFLSLKEFKNIPMVIWHILRAISHLTTFGNPPTYEEAGRVKSFVDAGVIDHVATVFIDHAQQAAVVEQACCLIENLASCNEESRLALVQGEICESLMLVLHAFGGPACSTSTVADQAWRTVEALCQSSYAAAKFNKLDIVSVSPSPRDSTTPNAFAERVSAILAKHFSVQSSEKDDPTPAPSAEKVPAYKAYLSENLSRAVASLAPAFGLSSSPGNDGTHPVIAVVSPPALKIPAEAQQQSQSSYMADLAAPFLELARRSFPEASHAPLTLEELAVELKKCAGYSFDKDVAATLQLVETAIGNDKQKQEALGAIPSVAVSIVKCLETFEGSGDVCRAALQAIDVLCHIDDDEFETRTNDRNVELLGEAGACAAVVSALQRHGVQLVDLTRLGCRTVRWLSSHAKNRMRLFDAGAVTWLVSVLRALGLAHDEIAEHACGAVKNIATNAKSIRSKIASDGAISAMEALLNSTVLMERSKNYVRRTLMQLR